MMQFGWPGWPAGWANNSTAGDGSLTTLTTADRNKGFRVDGVPTLQKLNALTQELARQVGFLFGGYGTGSLPAGAVTTWPVLEDAVGKISTGKVMHVAEVVDDMPLTAQWSDASQAWNRVWASGDAVYVATTGAAGRYARLDRTTGQVIWSITAGADYNVKDIAGDGVNIYVTAESVASAVNGYVMRLDAGTGQTVATYTSSGNINPLRITWNGSLWISREGNYIRAYNSVFVNQWSYDHGVAIADHAVWGDSVYLVSTTAGTGTNYLRRLDAAAGTATKSVNTAMACHSVACDGRSVYVGTMEDADGCHLRQYDLTLNFPGPKIALWADPANYVYAIEVDASRVMAVLEDATGPTQETFILDLGLQRVLHWRETASIVDISCDGVAIYDAVGALGARQRCLNNAGVTIQGSSVGDAYGIPWNDRAYVLLPG